VLQERNGVGTFYTDLREYLKKYLKDVRIFGPKKTNNSTNIFSIAMPGDNTQRLYFPKISVLSNFIKDFKPDIIILPTPGPYGLIGFKIAKNLNIPILSVLHNDYDSMASLFWISHIGKLIGAFGKFVNSLFFRNSYMVLIVNDGMKYLARELGSERIETIGTPLAKIFVDRPIVPIKRQVEKVLYAGRLSLEKGIQKIISAARAIPDLEFVFAGEGPLRKELENQCKNLKNVTFLGWISRNELVDRIDECQIMVLPSTIETFGTSALEGMSRGRIIIISGEAGITSWSSLDNMYINNGEFESLTDTIEHVIYLDELDRVSLCNKVPQVVKQFNQETISRWIEILMQTYESKIF
jgi:glycosyltransferase involved in cell wall biosynthesis